LRKLKQRLGLKKTELLVLIVFFLINLRILAWFQYPNIIVGGDLRPPFVLEAFMKRVAYTWNEIDFGVPSVYAPRILDPFYFFTTVFETLGASACIAQMITVFLMYFFSSILMYVFVKQLTGGNVTASFVAAIYLISNVYLINDREVTAIGFIDLALMILPCLITFVKGLETRSYKLMALSGILAVLTQTTFPNYRTLLIFLIMVCLVLVFLSLGKRIHFAPAKGHVSLNVNLPYHLLKLLAVAGTVFLLASLWVIVITISNFGTLTSAYAQIVSPWFIGGLKMYDVTRLIVRWGFYNGGLGVPYLPYGNVYLTNPLLIFSCYLPAVIAFASLFLSKERKIAVFFGTIAVISLLLTSGFSSFGDYGTRLYSDLMELVFLKVFREASNWIFFVIVSFGVLIGCTISALCQVLKKNWSKLLVIGLVVAMFLYTSYPLTTGEVTRNWLDLNIKGSYLPSSYVQLNEELPTEYWSILLPQRTTYVVYNFTEGNFSCGNPYPLIFSKPVISGTGTEYIQARNLDLINAVNYQILYGKYENVASKGIASASSEENSTLTPDKAIDMDYTTRWSSGAGFPQWFQIEWDKPQELWNTAIYFESALASDFAIETWNGSRWIIQTTVTNNTSWMYEYQFPQLVSTTRLAIYFYKAGNPQFNSVSMWELQVYAQTESVSKFMGILGIKDIILEKDIISGHLNTVNDLKLDEYKEFTPIREWNEMTLYENAYALEKIFVADNVLRYSDFANFYKPIQDLEWSTLQRSVFLPNSSSANLSLTMPKSLVWREISPTSFQANVESSGQFCLVLLESYDENWKVFSNGNLLPEESHVEVNGFANGWLIKDTGNLVIKIEYETQSLLEISAVASAILPALVLLVLSRKDIKKVARAIRSRRAKADRVHST
jgi:hypothetical protein